MVGAAPKKSEIGPDGQPVEAGSQAALLTRIPNPQTRGGAYKGLRRILGKAKQLIGLGPTDDENPPVTTADEAPSTDGAGEDRQPPKPPENGDNGGTETAAAAGAGAAAMIALWEALGQSKPLLTQTESGGLVWQNPDGTPAQPPEFTKHLPKRDFSNLGPQSTSGTQVDADVLQQFSGKYGPEGAKKLRAFLNTIADFEGTANHGNNGYNVEFGYRQFTSYNDHPADLNTSGQLASTAAGRYQFLHRTWAQLKQEMGLKDFSPAAQDAAALRMIEKAGALDDVLNGRYDVAEGKIHNLWASLPGAHYDHQVVHRTREQFVADVQRHYAQDNASPPSGAPPMALARATLHHGPAPGHTKPKHDHDHDQQATA